MASLRDLAAFSSSPCIQLLIFNLSQQLQVTRATEIDDEISGRKSIHSPLFKVVTVLQRCIFKEINPVLTMLRCQGKTNHKRCSWVILFSQLKNFHVP